MGFWWPVYCHSCLFTNISYLWKLCWFLFAIPRLDYCSNWLLSRLVNLDFSFGLCLSFVLLFSSSIAFFELMCFFLLIFYHYLLFLTHSIALRKVLVHHYNIDHLNSNYSNYDVPWGFLLFHFDFWFQFIRSCFLLILIYSCGRIPRFVLCSLSDLSFTFYLEFNLVLSNHY